MYEAIYAHLGRAFDWGVNDCCLFAARVVDAMCDSQYEQKILEKYTDEASALAFIAEYGSLANAVSSIIGTPAQGRAHRGDVVMIHVNERDVLGICVGRDIAIKSTGGVDYAPRSLAKVFWRI